METEEQKRKLDWVANACKPAYVASTAAAPDREQRGFVQMPHGLLRDPRYEALPLHAKVLHLYAMERAFFPDEFDLDAFDAAERRVAGQLEDDQMMKNAGKPAAPTMFRRYYLLDGYFMTNDYVAQHAGVKHYNRINDAIDQLWSLGLLRVRVAKTARKRFTNLVRFFIVYDHIDPARCKTAAPERLWDKLAHLSQRRANGYFLAWARPENTIVTLIPPVCGPDSPHDVAPIGGTCVAPIGGTNVAPIHPTDGEDCRTTDKSSFTENSCVADCNTEGRKDASLRDASCDVGLPETRTLEGPPDEHTIGAVSPTPSPDATRPAPINGQDRPIAAEPAARPLATVTPINRTQRLRTPTAADRTFPCPQQTDSIYRDQLTRFQELRCADCDERCAVAEIVIPPPEDEPRED